MKKIALPLAALAIFASVTSGAPRGGTALSLGWFGDGACDDAEAANPGALGGCRYVAEADCGNGIDDDSDERTDCLDSDCPACAGTCRPTERDADGDCTEDYFFWGYACGDHDDNDGDGYTDGCDLDCVPGDGGYCGGENCQLYGDEDGDGAWDGCDLDCAPGDGGACAEGDGRAEWSLSSGRGGNSSCSPSAEICGDGLDQDCDGRDTACAAVCGDGRCVAGETCGNCAMDCGGCTGGDVELCDNGEDDDADSYADCADSGCASDVSCAGPSEVCNDGIDNDADGWADCWDGGCADGLCLEFAGLGEAGWPTDSRYADGDPRNGGNPKGKNSDGTSKAGSKSTRACCICEYEATTKEYLNGRLTYDGPISDADKTEARCDVWLESNRCLPENEKKEPMTSSDYWESSVVDGETYDLLTSRCFGYGSLTVGGTPACTSVDTEVAGHGDPLMSGECKSLLTKMCVKNPEALDLGAYFESCALGNDVAAIGAGASDVARVARAKGYQVNIRVTAYQAISDFGDANVGSEITVSVSSGGDVGCDPSTTISTCEEQEGQPCTRVMNSPEGDDQDPRNFSWCADNETGLVCGDFNESPDKARSECVANFFQWPGTPDFRDGKWRKVN